MTTRVGVANPTKAILLGLGLVAVVVLGITGVLSSEAVAGALSMVMGYIAGNTVGAKQRENITPVIGRRTYGEGDQP